MDFAIQFNDIDEVKKLLSEGHTFSLWHIRLAESVEMYELIVKHMPLSECYSFSLSEMERRPPKWTKKGEWMTFRYILGLLRMGARETYYWPDFFRDYASIEMLEVFRAYLPFDSKAVDYALECFPLRAPYPPQLIIIDDCRKIRKTWRARKRKYDILSRMYKREFDSLAYEATVLLLHGQVFFPDLIRHLHSYI